MFSSSDIIIQEVDGNSNVFIINENEIIIQVLYKIIELYCTKINERVLRSAYNKYVIRIHDSKYSQSKSDLRSFSSRIFSCLPYCYAFASVSLFSFNNPVSALNHWLLRFTNLLSPFQSLF